MPKINLKYKKPNSPFRKLDMFLILLKDKVDVFMNTIYEKYIEINVFAWMYIVFKMPKKAFFWNFNTKFHKI